MARGRLISGEGLDGAGKTGHLQWLAERLRCAGETVVCTREPGGTPLGDKLRALLLAEPMDPDTELLLMFASRREHLVQRIEPALARGETVIVDRFHDSSYAFQGGGRGSSTARIAQLDAWVGGARPDLTLYFDVPVGVGLARVAAARELDRFESENRAFHERVRAAYLSRAAAEPQRIRVIDANRPIEAVRADLAAALAA